MKEKVYIRTDGGPDIGLGHLIRCMALAHMLRDIFNITFFSKEIPDSIDKDISDQGFFTKKIVSEEDFFSALKGSEVVVLDHYELDSGYQKKIKETGCKLVCIDDLHDRKFYADLIINHAPGITPAVYNAQKHTKFALGLDYVLLRPSFLAAARKNRKTDKNKTIFVCFGGSDIKNLTSRCLNILVEKKKFETIIVVVGVAFENFEEVELLSRTEKNVKLYRGIDEKMIVKLLKNSDLAIVPASGILLEVMSTGCKVISGMYAENQKHIYNFTKNAGLIYDAGSFDGHTIKKAIEKALIEKSSHLNVIDGNSPKRLRKLFLELKTTFRKVEEEDCQLLFRWANDPTVRIQAFSTDPISWDDHKRWFEKKIRDAETQIYILEAMGNPIGQIRYEREDNYWKIDYSIDAEYRGLGFGSKIVKWSLDEIKGNIKAWVKKGNKGSCRIFENLGFIKEEDGPDKIKYSLYK